MVGVIPKDGVLPCSLFFIYQCLHLPSRNVINLQGDLTVYCRLITDDRPWVKWIWVILIKNKRKTKWITGLYSRCCRIINPDSISSSKKSIPGKIEYSISTSVCVGAGVSEVSTFINQAYRKRSHKNINRSVSFGQYSTFFNESPRTLENLLPFPTSITRVIKTRPVTGKYVVGVSTKFDRTYQTRCIE